MKILQFILTITLLPTLLNAQEAESINSYSYTVHFPSDFRAIDETVIMSTAKTVWRNYIKLYNVSGKKSEKTDTKEKNNIVSSKNVVVYDIAKVSPFDIQASFGSKSVRITCFFYPSGYSRGLPYDTVNIQRFSHAYLLNFLSEIEQSRFDAHASNHKKIAKKIEKSENKIADANEQIAKAERKVKTAEKVITVETANIKRNQVKLQQSEKAMQETTRKISQLE